MPSPGLGRPRSGETRGRPKRVVPFGRPPPPPPPPHLRVALSVPAPRATPPPAMLTLRRAAAAATALAVGGLAAGGTVALRGPLRAVSEAKAGTSGREFLVSFASGRSPEARVAGGAFAVSGRSFTAASSTNSDDAPAAPKLGDRRLGTLKGEARRAALAARASPAAEARRRLSPPTAWPRPPTRRGRGPADPLARPALAEQLARAVSPPRTLLEHINNPVADAEADAGTADGRVPAPRRVRPGLLLLKCGMTHEACAGRNRHTRTHTSIVSLSLSLSVSISLSLSLSLSLTHSPCHFLSLSPALSLSLSLSL